jgi:hypothetical protein
VGFIGVDSLEACVGCVAGVGLSRGGFPARFLPTVLLLLAFLARFAVCASSFLALTDDVSLFSVVSMHQLGFGLLV